MPSYEAVIGLETHIQLNTKSKVFCACKADSWGDPPNSNICPVCTGLPGVLPTLNRAVMEKALLLALAVRAQDVRARSYFARKNYFYPDLPKGYQISQHDEPLARGGRFIIPSADGELRTISITKVHIEEDAGKTVYENGRRLIDFNRCGVPLAEIVTGPDLRSADEAAQYVIRLRQMVRWLGVSEGDMEKGHLRSDANVSVRLAGSQVLNPKTEIKNLNSIESVRAAIQMEFDRQLHAVEAGRQIEAWTLSWDETSASLQKMRAKESEADYRYFREPDLLPMPLEEPLLDRVQAELPELPLERRSRLIEQHGIPLYDAEILTEERSLSEYFEAAVAAYGGEAKVISNWLMNDVLRLAREVGRAAGDLRLRPEHLAEIVHLVQKKTITATTGKDLLAKVEATGQTPSEIVRGENLAQVSDEDSLRAVAREILAENPEQVASYKAGKTTLLAWFVGQMMRKTGGKANPQLARTLFERLLAE